MAIAKKPTKGIRALFKSSSAKIDELNEIYGITKKEYESWPQKDRAGNVSDKIQAYHLGNFNQFLLEINDALLQYNEQLITDNPNLSLDERKEKVLEKQKELFDVRIDELKTLYHNKSLANCNKEGFDYVNLKLQANGSKIPKQFKEAQSAANKRIKEFIKEPIDTGALVRQLNVSNASSLSWWAKMQEQERQSVSRASIQDATSAVQQDAPGTVANDEVTKPPVAQAEGAKRFVASLETSKLLARPTFAIAGEDQWAKAHAIVQARLKENPDEKGFKIEHKTEDELEHSFIYAQGKLYCVQRAQILGKGNFGEVKLALDEEGNPFVIKIQEMKEGRSLDPESEVQIEQALGRDLGEFTRERGEKTSLNYQVKPYLGASLAELLKRGLLSEEDRLKIALKVNDALKELHDQGIIHNDLNPGNILVMNVDDDIEVNLIDFGLSNQLKDRDKITYKDHEDEFPMRMARDYIPPEVIGTKQNTGEKYRKKDAHVSRESDMYQLGVLFLKRLKLDVRNNPDLRSLLAINPAERPSHEALSQTLSKLQEKSVATASESPAATASESPAATATESPVATATESPVATATESSAKTAKESPVTTASDSSEVKTKSKRKAVKDTMANIKSAVKEAFKGFKKRLHNFKKAREYNNLESVFTSKNEIDALESGYEDFDNFIESSNVQSPAAEASDYEDLNELADSSQVESPAAKASDYEDLNELADSSQVESPQAFGGDMNEQAVASAPGLSAPSDMSPRDIDRKQAAAALFETVQTEATQPAWKKVFNELIETEQSHIKGLEILTSLKKTFANMDPAMGFQDFISAVEVSLEAHKDLLKLLQAQQDKMPPNLGEVAKALEKLKSSDEACVSLLNKHLIPLPKLNEFGQEKMAEAQKLIRQKDKMADFDSLGISVVQRAPRYILLMSDYIKELGKNPTPDEQATKLSLEGADQFLKEAKALAEITNQSTLNLPYIEMQSLFDSVNEATKERVLNPQQLNMLQVLSGLPLDAFTYREALEQDPEVKRAKPFEPLQASQIQAIGTYMANEYHDDPTAFITLMQEMMEKVLNFNNIIDKNTVMNNACTFLESFMLASANNQEIHEKSFMDRLNQFVEEVNKIDEKLGSVLEKTVLKARSTVQQTQLSYNAFNDEFNDVASSKSSEAKQSWSQMLDEAIQTKSKSERKEFVNQIVDDITMKDAQLLVKVDPADFKDKGWEDKNESALKDFIANSNSLAASIREDIVYARDRKEQLKLIEIYTEAAHVCMQKGNFNGMGIIFGALNHASVKRLYQEDDKIDKSLFPSDTVKMYREVEAALSPDMSFKALRELQRAHQGPVIPHLTVALQDMTFAHDGNTRETVGYNPDRQTLYGQLVYDFLKYQQGVVNKLEITPMTTALMDRVSQPHVDEDILYARSLQVKPRDGKPFPNESMQGPDILAAMQFASTKSQDMLYTEEPKATPSLSFNTPEDFSRVLEKFKAICDEIKDPAVIGLLPTLVDNLLSNFDGDPDKIKESIEILKQQVSDLNQKVESSNLTEHEILKMNDSIQRLQGLLDFSPQQLNKLNMPDLMMSMRDMDNQNKSSDKRRSGQYDAPESATASTSVSSTDAEAQEIPSTFAEHVQAQEGEAPTTVTQVVEPDNSLKSQIDDLSNDCKDLIERSMKNNDVFAPKDQGTITFSAPGDQRTSYRDEKRKLIMEVNALMQKFLVCANDGKLNENIIKEFEVELQSLLSKNKALDNIAKSHMDKAGHKKTSHPAQDMIEKAQSIVEQHKQEKFGMKAEGKPVLKG